MFLIVWWYCNTCSDTGQKFVIYMHAQRQHPPILPLSHIQQPQIRHKSYLRSIVVRSWFLDACPVHTWWICRSFRCRPCTHRTHAYTYTIKSDVVSVETNKTDATETARFDDFIEPDQPSRRYAVYLLFRAHAHALAVPNSLSLQCDQREVCAFLRFSRITR